MSPFVLVAVRIHRPIIFLMFRNLHVQTITRFCTYFISFHFSFAKYLSIRLVCIIIDYFHFKISDNKLDDRNFQYGHLLLIIAKWQNKSCFVSCLVHIQTNFVNLHIYSTFTWLLREAIRSAQTSKLVIFTWLTVTCEQPVPLIYFPVKPETFLNSRTQLSSK